MFKSKDQTCLDSGSHNLALQTKNHEIFSRMPLKHAATPHVPLSCLSLTEQLLLFFAKPIGTGDFFFQISWPKMNGTQCVPKERWGKCEGKNEKQGLSSWVNVFVAREWRALASKESVKWGGSEEGVGEGRGEGRPVEKRRAVITMSYSRDNKGLSRALWHLGPFPHLPYTQQLPQSPIDFS